VLSFKLEKGLKLIPPHMHGAIRRYLENGIVPGSFLTAVICNQLKESFMFADEENRKHMYQWADFMYNYMPFDSQGSPEKFRAWVKAGGFAGIEEGYYDDSLEPKGES